MSCHVLRWCLGSALSPSPIQKPQNVEVLKRFKRCFTVDAGNVRNASQQQASRFVPRDRSSEPPSVLRRRGIAQSCIITKSVLTDYKLLGSMSHYAYVDFFLVGCQPFLSGLFICMPATTTTTKKKEEEEEEAKLQSEL